LVFSNNFNPRRFVMAQVIDVPQAQPRSEAAKAMMHRMKRLGERCAVAADAGSVSGASALDVERTPEANAPADREPAASHGPTPRDQAMGARLAEVLDDHASLNYYTHLAGRLRVGALLSDRSAPQRRDYIFAKARQLAARRVPHGPIRNPAACFVGWVKGLG